MRHTFAIVTSMFLLVVVVFLIWGERFLWVGDHSDGQRADVVVVLAGGPEEDPERVQAGAAMVEDGIAKFLLLPLRHKSLEWSWFVQNYGIREAVRRERVIIGREASTDDSIMHLGGTFAEARKTIEIMGQHRFSSAIVVTSGYHLRRARLAFERVSRDATLVFYYHPVPATLAKTGSWWADGGYLLRVLDEYRKLVAAYFVYG
jgi:uncharacterized SAM-binding protein YcdF (DUF218 family)